MIRSTNQIPKGVSHYYESDGGFDQSGDGKSS
jgi:hypothetical protein